MPLTTQVHWLILKIKQWTPVVDVEKRIVQQSQSEISDVTTRIHWLILVIKQWTSNMRYVTFSSGILSQYPYLWLLQA